VQEKDRSSPAETFRKILWVGAKIPLRVFEWSLATSTNIQAKQSLRA